jgi:hypothetical protein
VNEADRERRDGSSPRPVERKVVSAPRLLTLLNKRLDSYGHCHQCRFVGPIRHLDEVAEDGRNWNVYVPFVCSESVGSGCKRIAERILDDAALEYNLKPPA